MLFDMLVAPEGTVLIDKPLRQRRQILETFMKKAAVAKRLLLSPCTTNHVKAVRWLTEAGNGGTDGVMAKRLDDNYIPGERKMVKVKRLRTADCVVGGFRYASKGRQVDSDFMILLASSTTSALPRRSGARIGPR
jgi:ATP-dependent DNA ligase